jgi:cytidyltransferase-like protein
MKAGVVEGRFQPLHKGHLALIEAACKEYPAVAVGIFCPGEDEKNPFSYDEVREMITRSLGKECLKKVKLFRFYPPGLYPAKSFEKELPYPKESLEFLVATKGEGEKLKMSRLKEHGLGMRAMGAVCGPSGKAYSAEAVRRSIASGDGKWKAMVPEPVRELLESSGAAERVRNKLLRSERISDNNARSDNF